MRTVWWVRGVGPGEDRLRHAGGEVSRAELQSARTCAPLPLPPDVNLLPLNRGDTRDVPLAQQQHMKKWSTQQLHVAEVVNNTARVDVKHVAGPIKVAGAYTFATRLSGVTQLSGGDARGDAAQVPAARARAAPTSADRRRFFTPFDLMVYGFNPIVPVYAETRRRRWRSSRASRDWKIFGVTGDVEGRRDRARCGRRAGRFAAIVVRSTLRQAGFPFGSGTRTS